MMNYNQYAGTQDDLQQYAGTQDEIQDQEPEETESEPEEDHPYQDQIEEFTDQDPEEDLQVARTPKEDNQLAPLQLQSENEILKAEVMRQKQLLDKAEDKLEKKRQFIKEMNFLQNDISEIKQNMKQDGQRDSPPKVDNVLQAENQALKAQVEELEAKLAASTHRSGEYEDQKALSELTQMRELFESKVQQLQLDNEEKEQLFFELRRQDQVRKHELDIKNDIIHKLQRQIHSIVRPTEHVNLIADLNELKTKGDNPDQDRGDKGSEKFVSLRNQRRSDQFTNFPNNSPTDFDAEKPVQKTRIIE